MRTVCRQQAIDEAYAAVNKKMSELIGQFKELCICPFGLRGLQRKNNERISFFLKKLTGEEVKVINDTIRGGKGSRS